MANKSTPLAIARAFAREHPDFSGLVAIDTLAPKGRFGRLGLSNRTVRAWVKQGDAALAAGRWTTLGSIYNGQCEICGTVYFDKQLRTLYAPDPDAGQSVERAWLPWGCTRAEIAPLAYVHACPPCADQHSLTEDQPKEILDDVYREARRHPTLCRHNSDMPVYTLDMCDLVLGRADRPSIFEYGTRQLAFQ